MDPEEYFLENAALETFSVHATLPNGRARGSYSSVGLTLAERMEKCYDLVRGEYPEAIRILISVPADSPGPLAPEVWAEVNRETT